MGGKRKIILSLAPVGNFPEDTAEVVLSPKGIAADVEECAAAGASLVHLHVKDSFGQPVTDRSLFDEVVKEIRRRCNVILQGSTGGDGHLSAEERCVVLDNPVVEMASLNMGSTNFFNGVYINAPDEIRYWARRMKDSGIEPELEIFSPDMIDAAAVLYREQLIDPPYSFGICLGIPWAMPADARYLSICANLMPEEARWGLIEHARSDFSLVAVALALGASWIRVGQEDSPQGLNHTGQKENAVLVTEARDFIESLGYDIASPQEARKILEIPEPKDTGT